MSLLPKSASRAESARINGAKSTGPTTPEGLDRARTAPLQHGIYASIETLNASVDPAHYEAIRQKFHQIWQAHDDYTALRVDELAHAHCILTRLQSVLRIQMSELYADLKSVYDVEIAASMPGSIVGRLESRIRRQQLNISRIERDILRLKKQLKDEEGSHKVLETKPAETLATPEPGTPEPPAQVSCSNPIGLYYPQTAPPAHPPGPTC
jgi:hypothetical protein